MPIPNGSQQQQQQPNKQQPGGYNLGYDDNSNSAKDYMSAYGVSSSQQQQMKTSCNNNYNNV